MTFTRFAITVRPAPHVDDELEGARAESVDALADVGAGVGGRVHPADLEEPLRAAEHGVSRPAVGVDTLFSLQTFNGFETRLRENVSRNLCSTNLVPLNLERLVPDDGTAELEIVALADTEEPLRVPLHVRRHANAAPAKYRSV